LVVERQVQVGDELLTNFGTSLSFDTVKRAVRIFGDKRTADLIAIAHQNHSS
jgi:hypothetical protein